MKAILQRVTWASVTVDGQLVSKIGKGILVLAAVGKDDTIKEAESLAAKVLKLRMWDDWKQNVKDIDGEVLCVSQFTLLASTKKGNKPDFHKSANGEQAKTLYSHFFQNVSALYLPERVKDGVFQAMMNVALENDGPVTFEINVDPPIASVGGSSKIKPETVQRQDKVSGNV